MANGIPPNPESTFAAEVAEIQATYADYHRQDLTKTIWAPLAVDEVGVRTQQVRLFAEFMRATGRQHLGGLRILDLGCATGRHVRQFIDMGAGPADVTGTDIDPITLTRAREVSPNLAFVSGNGATLDFPGGSFDLVTHHYVFSSVPSAGLRQQLAQEVKRVLRPGGLFFWWDILHLATQGQKEIALDVRDLFGDSVVVERKVALQPAPSETLRPCRGLSKLIAPLLDRMGHRVCRQAALVRKAA